MTVSSSNDVSSDCIMTEEQIENEHTPLQMDSTVSKRNIC